MTVNADMVRSIVERIAVRGEDDGECFTNTARADAIAECLKDGDWRLYHDGNLAKIYVHRDFEPKKPVVVVSSHVDMVAKSCYAECLGDIWKGSFDNLITNAVVVACMNTGAFGTDVLVAFTGDEEEESGGADEVVEALDEREIAVKFVVVTDVTEEGWHRGKSFTIENVFPEEDEEMQRRQAATLRGMVTDLDPLPCVVVEGAADEAWEYDEYGLPCCSVCMPCTGEMHSEEGVEVRASSIAPYAQALAAVTTGIIAGE